MFFNTGGTCHRVTFEKLMMKIYDFLKKSRTVEVQAPSRLVSVCNNINENLPSSRFLLILLQTETKRLSRSKKIIYFHH